MLKSRRVPPAPAKLQGQLPAGAGPVKVVVKVHTPGHVPPAARLSARIDATMFTAEVDADKLAEVADDPQVAAISVGSPILPAAR